MSGVALDENAGVESGRVRGRMLRVSSVNVSGLGSSVGKKQSVSAR